MEAVGRHFFFELVRFQGNNDTVCDQASAPLSESTSTFTESSPLFIIACDIHAHAPNNTRNPRMPAPT